MINIIYGYEIIHQKKQKKSKEGKIVFSENLKTYICCVASLFSNKCYEYIQTPKISK